MTYPRYQRRVSPAVSASLIHEGRMIFQQLFEGFSSRRQERRTIFKEESIGGGLICILCLRNNKKVTPAVGMVNGNSMCKEHVVNDVVVS